MRADSPVSILMVDDHAMFIEGLALLLERDHRVRACSVASSPDQAIALLVSSMPDVVLLDVDLNAQPADQTIRRMLRLHPRLCIVMLTMHTYEPLLDTFIRAGARAYLNKSLSAKELVDSVVSVLRAPRQHERRHGSQRSGVLSTREVEVLRLVALAKSNSEIAHELSIAEGTVKRHLHEINSRLGASNRIDATRKAKSLGYLNA